MLSIICLSVLALVLPQAANAGYCDYILKKDCNFVADANKVCGTNGVTYRNSCYLAKAYCHDGTTHKVHDGACAQPTTTPTPTTTPKPIDGGSIALDIFCLDIAYVSCGTGGTRVCGSDGNYYPNMCEFDKQRCTHRDIHANGVNCS